MPRPPCSLWRRAPLWAALVLRSAGVRLQSSDSPAAEGANASWRAFHDGTHKLAWFHPPSTATSFATTLFHYANASLPREEGAKRLRAWRPFFTEYPPEIWFRDGLWHEECDHGPVTNKVYREFKGHFAGLFRNPVTRIAARWIAGAHMTIPDYARRVNGSVALQLAGQAHGEDYISYPTRKYCCGKHLAVKGLAPPPDMKLALRRLKEGFMFVGLVEEFDLSVCLFHAMFGGECLPVEFENMRKGSPKPQYPELNDLRDADQTLYDAAAERFWADVRAHGVERRFCQKLCASASHIFGGGGETDGGDDSITMAKAGEMGPEYDWPGRWFLDDDVDQ